jgi:hypothetical protein
MNRENLESLKKEVANHFSDVESLDRRILHVLEQFNYNNKKMEMASKSKNKDKIKEYLIMNLSLKTVIDIIEEKLNEISEQERIIVHNKIMDTMLGDRSNYESDEQYFKDNFYKIIELMRIFKNYVEQYKNIFGNIM